MKALITLILATLLSACGSYQTSAQSEPASYIQFVGEAEQQTFSLNGKDQGKLSALKSFNENGRELTRIEVPAGTHTLEVMDAGKTLIKRKIYVSEGNAFEVQLP